MVNCPFSSTAVSDVTSGGASIDCSKSQKKPEYGEVGFQFHRKQQRLEYAGQERSRHSKGHALPKGLRYR